MTPDHRREIAAKALCGCIEGMILAGAIADHSVDYVMKFVTELRSSHGLPVWVPPAPLPVCNDNTSIAALDETLDHIAMELA